MKKGRRKTEQEERKDKNRKGREKGEKQKRKEV
jgi:hypothetical protein